MKRDNRPASSLNLLRKLKSPFDANRALINDEHVSPQSSTLLFNNRRIFLVVETVSELIMLNGMKVSEAARMSQKPDASQVVDNLWVAL
jgi:hypothetical protein